MRNKISKKDRDIFVEAVTNGLIKMGAKITPVDKYNRLDVGFTLETSVGELEISLRRDQAFIFMVFSRFEDATRAKARFCCNPYSGKYNFTCLKDEETSARKAADNAIKYFQQTLPKK